MEQPAPRHIEENPSLPDGLYDALIHDIRLRGSSRETQIWMLFYLPDQQVHLVTRFRASKKSYNRQHHQRLIDFCSAINVDIHPLLNTPRHARGRQLRVKTRRSYYDADGTTHWYSEVVGFMPYGTDAERNAELGMEMIPHSGLAH